MLIYEKYVEEEIDGETVKVRHLFGTMGNLPANDDAQLTYKDNDGDTITVEPTDMYVDGGSKEGIQYINRLYTEDEEAKEERLNVFIGDKCVVGKVEEKNIVSIEVTTLPTKSSYSTGETLDLTGLEVTGTFADGDVAVLTTNDYTTSPVNGATLSTQGDVTVTVTAGEVTDSFVVEVTAPPYPEGLSLIKGPTNNVIYPGYDYAESHDYPIQPNMAGTEIGYNINGVVHTLVFDSQSTDTTFDMKDEENNIYSFQGIDMTTDEAFSSYEASDGKYYIYTGSGEYWLEPYVDGSATSGEHSVTYYSYEAGGLDGITVSIPMMFTIVS